MRISDWSSDVCSSDLDLEGLTIAPPANSDQSFQLTVTATSAEGANGETNTQTATVDVTIDAVADAPELTVGDVSGEEGATVPLDLSAALTDTDGSEALSITISGRTEEHTSGLQALLRTSYAVFCLQKQLSMR